MPGLSSTRRDLEDGVTHRVAVCWHSINTPVDMPGEPELEDVGRRPQPTRASL